MKNTIKIEMTIEQAVATKLALESHIEEYNKLKLGASVLEDAFSVIKLALKDFREGNK